MDTSRRDSISGAMSPSRAWIFFAPRRRWLGNRIVNISRTLDLVGVSMDVACDPLGSFGRPVSATPCAFALVRDPNVLLLDEPTAGVDEPGQEQLNELVGRLQRDRGLTVLFISHELTVVYRYATHVLWLSRGRTCIGPPERQISCTRCMQRPPTITSRTIEALLLSIAMAIGARLAASR